MGYDNMDHADWVERNIAACKRRLPKRQRKDNTRGFGAAPDALSPFERKVMDILGIVGGGIYNAPILWDSVQWKNVGGGIIIPWAGDLSTYDFRKLTDLVLLCHAARIRCGIKPYGPRHLALVFHQRSASADHFANHPDIAEAIDGFNGRFPVGHSVHFTRELADV